MNHCQRIMQFKMTCRKQMSKNQFSPKKIGRAQLAAQEKGLKKKNHSKTDNQF